VAPLQTGNYHVFSPANLQLEAY